MKRCDNSENMCKAIKAVAFDLDGTIYLGSRIIDGAADVIAFLKERGIRVFYFTNASTRTRAEVLNKLSGMGLELAIDEVYTSAYACAKYASENSYTEVFCLGAAGLKSEMNLMGIHVTDDERRVQAVIIGLDTDFSYDRLASIIKFTSNGCKIIACNRDRNFPVENHQLKPGCGPIVAAVEDFINRPVDYVAGKPHTYMMELLANDWGLRNSEILVVGDSYSSDIEMAKRYNCASVLISRDKINDLGETVVIDDIRKLKDILLDC